MIVFKEKLTARLKSVMSNAGQNQFLAGMRIDVQLDQNETGTNMKQILLALPALALLVACDEATTTDSASVTPTAAEQACLRDVTATTNNPDVVLLGSDFSEAGTLVRIGVGPDRTPWECIAYSDGTTDGITSLSDEGAL